MKPALLLVASASIIAFGISADAEVACSVSASTPRTQACRIAYRAYDGQTRGAVVLLPASGGSGRGLPLVVSPHGRGLNGSANARLWGDLPGLYGLAVVNPDGTRFSWGDPRAIADLARMPKLVKEALPRLRIDERRIFAAGGSMGGQETLLLLARYPGLLAGAVAVDPVTDLAMRYRDFPLLDADCDIVCRGHWGGPVGEVLRALARRYVGGTPEADPKAYAERSPIAYARRIAESGVPLQLWWSHSDRIIAHSDEQSGRLYEEMKKRNPAAPVSAFTGEWRHTSVFNAKTQLPQMLGLLGLVPDRELAAIPDSVRQAPPAAFAPLAAGHAASDELGYDRDSKGRLVSNATERPVVDAMYSDFLAAYRANGGHAARAAATAAAELNRGHYANGQSYSLKYGTEYSDTEGAFNQYNVELLMKRRDYKGVGAQALVGAPQWRAAQEAMAPADSPFSIALGPIDQRPIVLISEFNSAALPMILRDGARHPVLRRVPVYLGQYGIGKAHEVAAHSFPLGRYAPIFNPSREQYPERRLDAAETLLVSSRYGGPAPKRLQGLPEQEQIGWGLEIGRRIRDAIRAAERSGVRVDAFQFDEISGTAGKTTPNAAAFRDYLAGALHGVAYGRPELHDRPMRGVVFITNQDAFAKLPETPDVRRLVDELDRVAFRLAGEEYVVFRGDPRVASARWAQAQLELRARGGAWARLAARYVPVFTPGYDVYTPDGKWSWLNGNVDGKADAWVDSWRSAFVRARLRHGAAGIGEYCFTRNNSRRGVIRSAVSALAQGIAELLMPAGRPPSSGASIARLAGGAARYE